MTPLKPDEIQDEFSSYLNLLSQALPEPEQRASFAAYAIGLLSPLPRKSVEPIAALGCSRPEQVSAAHQRLLHFLANSRWDDHAVRRLAARYALGEMTKHAQVEVSIIDDTGMLKQGKHSVGVQRQYTGSAGKVTNCQLAVSLTVATPTAQLPIDMQLYLPQCWTQDSLRRKEGKIPDDVTFATKPQLALQMLSRASESALALGVVLADAAYGTSAEFRTGIRALRRHYMVGVNCTLLVQPVHRNQSLRPALSLAQLTEQLHPQQFRLYRWRQGSKGVMQSLFCLLRVHVPDDPDDATVWLIIEKTGEVGQPYKYSLSSLPAHTPRLRLVYLAKARWRTEQMYLECKEELGLDHYEGRSYPGWNHHVSAVLACYALVVAHTQCAFPPCAKRAAPHGALKGAPAAASARLDGHHVPAVRQSAAWLAASLPPLPTSASPMAPHCRLPHPSQADEDVTQ
jgi:SRSO17 transposase